MIIFFIFKESPNHNAEYKKINALTFAIPNFDLIWKNDFVYDIIHEIFLRLLLMETNCVLHDEKLLSCLHSTY